MNKAHRNSDQVPASELLKALNTLQLYTCNDQNDLSFGEHSFKAPQKSQKTMNFQIYMQKQTDKSKNKRVNNSQKTVSPLKEMTRSFAKTSDLSSNKRKSLTPLGRSSINKVAPSKRGEQRQSVQKQIDKQNREKNIEKSMTQMEMGKSSKVSEQSKKILNQRQKKGNAYVPIQMRAQCLLKERQAKLAKLQKEKQIEKMIEEKQCTFKPKISKNYHKKNDKAQKQKKEEKIEALPIQDDHFEVNEEQSSHSLKSLEVKTSQDIKKEQQRCITKQQRQQPIGFKKYKNQKFNSLLDLIH